MTPITKRQTTKPQPKPGHDLSQNAENLIALTIMAKLAAGGTRVTKPDVLRLLDLIRSNRLVKSTRSQTAVTICCERDDVEISLTVLYAALQDLYQTARRNSIEVQRCCDRVNNAVITTKFSRLLERETSSRIQTSNASTSSGKPDILVQRNQITFP